MAARIAAFDWSATALGPIEGWPETLKTLVGFLLRSPVPMVLLWGPEGKMIYNDGYSVIAAQAHPRLLGCKVLEGWPEAAEFNAHVMDVGLSGGTLAFRDQELTLYRTGKAEQVWMNLDYSPVIDEAGRTAGVIAIVVETTERVLADRRIEMEQARNREMLRHMPGFVGIVRGPEHVHDYVNESYAAIAQRSDIVGRPFREVFSDLGDQPFADLLDRVRATGEGVALHGMELPLRGDAEPRYVDFVFEPIRGEGRVVRGVFIGGYEVTEAARATKALQRSEARLRELNANLERQVIERTQARGKSWQLSPDLMGALNFEGYFETSNPAWETTLGWTEAEVARMSIFELLHPDDAPNARARFELAKGGQPVIQAQTRWRHKDGGFRWIAWVGVPDEGRVYCTGRDITEEKAAEEELEKAHDALRQAQKMEAVGQLTGGIAHDFNNLLAGISGSLEMLAKRLAEGRVEDVERYIDMAQTSTRRAAALTQRLLAFARRQTLDPRAIDANRLIVGMEDLIRRTVGPSIEVQVVGAGGLWLTRVDPLQLENSLLNLAINARDSMPEGGRITIETANTWLDARTAAERELSPGQYVSVCVSDTGSGMSAEVAARAFDPFYTTKPLGQGTGLGLSMVHGFVRQSGGQVRIHSELGQGTTMCLYLPRHMGPQDVVEAGPAVAEAQSDAGRGQTVLVIDDEVTVRNLIVEVLEDAGYRVLTAPDGPSGLDILQGAGRIDLLISDVGLPGGVNGRQVADAARVTRPDLRVLFITGYAENAVIGNGHLDPGMQVITKPFAMAALAARVQEIIAG